MSKIKLMRANQDIPVQVFMFSIYERENQELSKILVVATDVWCPRDVHTAWMDDPRFPVDRCALPGIDLIDDENIWEFPGTAEGEMAAHKKMCEIYAAELERIHKS